MATSKFRPTEIPDQVSPSVREYLDRTLTEMSVLLDGAADYIDDATIAHTDEAETITGAWTFDQLTAERVNLDTDGTDYSIYLRRSGTPTGGFYHDLTSQYWLNNLGQTVLQNVYGSKNLVTGNNLTVTGALTATSYGGITEANLLDKTAAETVSGQWLFTEASNALTLKSNAPKLKWWEEDAATDEKIWDIVTAAGDLRFRYLKDDESSQAQWLTVARTGYAVTTTFNGVTVALAPTGNIQLDPGGAVQVLSGNEVRCYEVDNDAYTYIKSTAQSGYTPAHYGAIAHTDGGAITFQSAAISDDATATFNGDGYGIAVIHNNYNASAYGMCGLAGVNAPIDYGSGSLVSYGATNPDVDGKVNVWPSSSGVLSIKNRLGSARQFYVIMINRVPG